MLATEELRHLQASITAMPREERLRISAAFTAPGVASGQDDPERRAVELVGLRRAHDVMFLAHYSKGPVGGPAWRALTKVALAVAALPYGLSQSDYRDLIAPAVGAIPWLALEGSET